MRSDQADGLLVVNGEGKTGIGTMTPVEKLDVNGAIRMYGDNAGDNEGTIRYNPLNSDFEGFNIYKSLDGGFTWGGPEDIIYDDKRVQVGWKPYKQFDLDATQDSLFCQNGFYNPAPCSRWPASAL